MKKVSLDQVYNPPSSLTIIIDLRVALFQLLSYYTPQTANLLWIKYFNSIHTKFALNHENVAVIVVDDKRDSINFNYWREQWLQANHSELPCYKGNRSVASDGDRPSGYNEMLSAAYEVIEKLKIPFFQKEGMEADDWAGLIFRHIKHSTADQLIFVTVDNDWLQLVSDKLRIKAFCCGSFNQSSYLKDEYEVLRYYKEKGVVLKSTYNLVEHKMAYGDAGDNIAENSPREIIDLRISPPEEYDFTSENEAEIAEALKNRTYIADVSLAAQALLKIMEISV